MNASEKTITSSPRKSNKTFTYKFVCEGYSGIVNVPSIYKSYIFTVTFDDCLGNNIKVKTLDDEVVKLPKDPERKGYTFLGWYHNADATSPFDHGTPITEDVYVYAGWSKNTADLGNRNSGATELPNTGDISNELPCALITLSVLFLFMGFGCFRKFWVLLVCGSEDTLGTRSRQEGYQ